jgi:hypothetical protein
MSVPTFVARDRIELNRALERTANADLVLVDTAGRSMSEAVARQAEMLRAVEGMQLYLVVSAGTGAREMAAAAERYRSMQPERLIVTKVDEAVGSGSLLSASVRIGRPIVAVSDGQRVPEDIHALSSTELVDLVVGTPQRIPAASVDPRIKNYHWLDFVMGLFEAYESGGETVVLTDGSGHVAEGPGFNVFAVFGLAIVTPAAGVLEGVTRRTMIELARREGFDVQVRELGVDELRRADEVFLSSTGGGAIAVAQLDGVAIGGRAAGAFGPVTGRMQAAYWGLHEDPRYTEAVRYG